MFNCERQSKIFKKPKNCFINTPIDKKVFDLFSRDSSLYLNINSKNKGLELFKNLIHLLGNFYF